MPAFYPEGDEPKLADPSGRSLHKINNLLKSIEAKTGSTTITGPVTVNNEVEIKNGENAPIPVSDNNSSLTVDGTVELGATSLAALENISVTFPATQNVNVTNAGLNVSVTNLPATQPVSGTFWPTTQPVSGSVSLIELIPQDSTLELIVSAETFGGSYLKSDPSYYQGSGDNKLYWSSGSARWEFRGDNDYLWTYNNSANQSAAYIPKTGWVMGDNPYFKGVEIYARKDIDLVKNVFGLGSGYEAAASGDQTGLSVVAILKRGLVHLSSIIAKLPNLISNRIPVDGSGVTQPVSLASVPSHPVTGTFWQATQPTRETQPTGDYAINTIALASFSLSGSAVQSASFDAGANADYVVISITGGGSSGALYYDLSTNNSTWDAGNTSGGFSTYYDIPATSTTDAYSYKNVSATSFFGATRSGYSARLIVPLQQSQPGSGTQLLYRYIRLNAPASNGGWRYKFTSYKSVDPLLAFSVPGNPSTTRVAGRVDVGYVSNLPALPTGTNTIGSVNVLGGNATAVKVDGSAVTQPVSIASAPVTPVTDNGGSLTVDGSITATQATAASLKAQAQLLNAAGSVVDYAMTGTAGTPATDVVTVQGISGGTSIPISGTVNTYPQQGTTSTNTNFSSITSAELAPAVANRESLTVYNEGPGTLFINVGGSCSTTSYQVRLFAGDYWEAPAGQLSLQHSGIFGTAGTARAVQVT